MHSSRWWALLARTFDAPDLISPAAAERKSPSAIHRKGTLNGAQSHTTQQFSERRSAKATSRPSRQILETDASASLRDQLVEGLKHLSSADEAASWAHRVLSEKNTLTAADAERVEAAFQARLANFVIDAVDGSSIQSVPTRRARTKKRRSFTAVDKSVLSFPVPRRIRDREHVKSVAQQPCLVCGRRPADAHHLRSAQSRALGRKVSDEFTVPLCRGHHREVHHCGDEAAWWERVGIDPIVTARTLWLKTHPLPPAPIGPKVAKSASTMNSQQSDRNQAVTRRGRNCKTKPISRVAPYDLVPAN